MSRYGYYSDFNQGQRDFERRGRPDMERESCSGFGTADFDYFEGYREAEREQRRQEERRQEECEAEAAEERRIEERRIEERRAEARRQAEAEEEEAQERYRQEMEAAQEPGPEIEEEKTP
jgi:hypothetical protein